MSAPSFRASAGWIAASRERDSDTSSSASPSRGDERSSEPDSPESPSTTTCETWAIEAVGRKMSGGPEVGLGIRNDGTMYTLDRESKHAVAFLSENQRAEVRLTETARQLTSGGGKPGQGYPAILISSAAASPVKTSQSQANAPDSPAPAPPSSMSLPESQENLFSPEDTFSLRTYRVFSVPTADGTSLPSSGQWPTSGFMISPGEFLTPDSSEFPSGGGVSSSLPDVLEADVAPKYFLSPRAAAGILRRAEKRGKKLPEHLEAVLRAVAQSPTPTE